MAVLLANNATGKLAGSVDATQTSISVRSGEGARFPSPSGNDWFPVTLLQADGTLEILRCTARSGDVLTVVRAQEATTAKEFSPDDRVSLRVTAAAFEDLRTPKGAIIKWSGAIADIPTGWALCDGTNGTIDLTDKFVVGAGGAYAVGDTGGANSVTLTQAQMPAHNHAASTGAAGGHNHGGSTGSSSPSTNTTGSHSHTGSTNTTGAHTHDVEYGKSQSQYTTRLSVVDDAFTEYVVSSATRSAGNHSHSLSINNNGSHSHTVASHSHSISSVSDHSHSVTVNSTGGDGSHENRPPYYALAFIQKL